MSTNPRIIKEKPLTDHQLVILTDTLCDDGKKEDARAEALLILIDEIDRARGKAGNLVSVVKRRAFSKCGDESIAAHIQLIRSEVPR